MDKSEATDHVSHLFIAGLEDFVGVLIFKRVHWGNGRRRKNTECQRKRINTNCGDIHNQSDTRKIGYEF